MKRHLYQIGRSHFEVEHRPTGWWVREEWTEIDTRGHKVDEFQDFGPFATEQEAWAKFHAVA